jgi:DNA polymerase-1
LREKLLPVLQDQNLLHLYEEIDLPLTEVLEAIEKAGIKINSRELQRISELYKPEIGRVEKVIYEEAGIEFNVRSTKQTAEVLGQIMDKTGKKTKTGQLSTSEEALSGYAESYQIAEYLLRYRKLSKLVSTYTESLPKYINKMTGRIHAEFLQVSTATGRLSCINPNLQNIPIRSQEGKEVRRAVIPENDDYLILSADYSQIELRILASLTGDEGLVAAFANNTDVHTVTAARVFSVNENEVTDDMRSKAKMVNYGIAYGLSAFGLSRNLKIKMAEAKEIIENYFSEFPSIRNFIDSSVSSAREKGYAETLTGRRRYIADINSGNGTERRAAERIAINAPVQGLAADMIKVSMINIYRVLKERKLKTKMIIQVHDELVFEVFKPELEEVKKIVRENMESAISLKVPVEINIGVGENWLELV